MNARHWFSALLVGLIGFAACGCMNDEVVYVDEQGNELAVDENGKPIYSPPTPARAHSVVTTTPVEPPGVIYEPAPATTTFVPSSTPSVPATPATPAPDAPPAGALPPVPSMGDLPHPTPVVPRPFKPAKPKAERVDDSSGLDKPPTG